MKDEALPHGSGQSALGGLLNPQALSQAQGRAVGEPVGQRCGQQLDPPCETRTRLQARERLLVKERRRGLPGPPPPEPGRAGLPLIFPLGTCWEMPRRLSHC